MGKKKDEIKDQDLEKLPRYAIKIQDNEGTSVVAAGTDDLDKFTKTDLMKMVNHFKKMVEEDTKPWSEIDENVVEGEVVEESKGSD